MNRAGRLALADELERSLWRDFADPFFPRAVDPSGGFWQSFDREWRLGPDRSKFVVYQSRLTWAAATLAEAFPDRRDEFGAYARHGLRFLLDRMGDAEGGFLWWVDEHGEPVGKHAGDRRTYGMSFALYALSAVARALSDPEALARAQRTFGWIEAHLHDPVLGGYFELADEHGEPVVAPRDPSLPGRADAIANENGWRTHNSQLHMLEAISELYRVWPDPLVKRRIEELLRILTVNFILPEGCSCSSLDADLQPATGNASYGHDIEAAHLLQNAADLVGADIGDAPRRLADHGLDHGWDASVGALFYAGTADGTITDPHRSWWLAAEALLGYAGVDRRWGAETDRYIRALASQWAFTREHQIDHEFGGWFGALDPQGVVKDGGKKAHAWKACYHETRGLLGAAAILRA